MAISGCHHLSVPPGRRTGWHPVWQWQRMRPSGRQFAKLASLGAVMALFGVWDRSPSHNKVESVPWTLGSGLGCVHWLGPIGLPLWSLKKPSEALLSLLEPHPCRKSKDGCPTGVRETMQRRAKGLWPTPANPKRLSCLDNCRGPRREESPAETLWSTQLSPNAKPQN